MAGQPFMNEMDKKYIESGVWKCTPSPTGAHHWVEVERRSTKSLFVCKYCLGAKEFPTVWSRPE